MQQDDETTGQELVSFLQCEEGVNFSVRTARRGRQWLGWTSRGTAYCQLIREGNHAKRLEWARENLGVCFENVIWSDETTVQLESHQRFSCKKRGQRPRYKSRPKHPCKVHVWAGISWKGATEVCIFEGIMAAQLYPGKISYSVYQVYNPSEHRFMQDNDPKQTSRRAQEIFRNQLVEDSCKPQLKHLWHELKVKCMLT